MSVDISAHHDPNGKLYYPSYPWGIHLHIKNALPDNGGPNVSNKAKTKADAIRKAKNLTGEGKSVTVFSRKTGKVVFST